MKKIKKVIYAYLITILLIILLFFLFKENIQPIINEPENIQIFISQFGILGPLMLILLQTFQVIIFIVPGQIFTLAGGFLFGTTLGTIYSIIGTILGSVLVFYFSRTLGRPFVEKWISKKELKKFDLYFTKKGKAGLVVSRMIPLLFPIDLISIAAGLTKITYKDFIIFSTIGLIPNIFLLTYLGSQISKGPIQLILITISIIGIVILMYIFRELLSNSIVKLENFIENKIKKVK